MRRPIILEGPDGAGKSTLAAALSKSLGLPVFHTGGPPADKKELTAKLKEVRKHAGRCIFDRVPHISEIVYRRVSQTKPFIPGSQMLHELEQDLRPVIVYCRLASISDMHQAISKEVKLHKPPEHLQQVSTRYQDVVNYYDEVMQYLSGAPTVTVIRYAWDSDTVDSLTEELLCAD